MSIEKPTINIQYKLVIGTVLRGRLEAEIRGQKYINCIFIFFILQFQPIKKLSVVVLVIQIKHQMSFGGHFVLLSQKSTYRNLILKFKIKIKITLLC